ncbi:MAG: tetratricopeptide repeat protein [Bacteroidetes bacterium]|nr:tetratricopeptide repeat protein [Bacteroidota bacterium]
MIILYSAGTFDGPKVVEIENANNSENVAQNQNSHDLTSLNEIKFLEEKVKNNPEDLNSLLSLSHLLNDSGFYVKAIENYKKYLIKDPKNVDVIIDMGVCFYQLGNYNSAIETMESGILINPKHQIAHFNLGIVNSAKGNISKSQEYFEKAIKIDPNSDIGIKAKNLLDNH